MVILALSLTLHHSLVLAEWPVLAGAGGGGQVHREMKAARNCLCVMMGKIGGNTELDQTIFLASRNRKCRTNLTLICEGAGERTVSRAVLGQQG